MPRTPATDTTKSVSELLDGFNALSEEYKALAKKHTVLREQLSAAKEQVLHPLIRYRYPHPTT